jgi:hypothetical protein
MNRPSSTITAASIAGSAAAVVWELVATFTQFSPTAGLIAGSVVVVSGAIGYWKKENVLNVKS